MSFEYPNRYWIPNFEISKKILIEQLQVNLGPGSTVRAYTKDGVDGFLISTPGECLTDEQIDDICEKSKKAWEKQVATRTRNESDKQLKRPLHQPIMISRGSAGGSSSSSSRQSRMHSGDGSKRYSDNYRTGEGSSSRGGY